MSSSALSPASNVAADEVNAAMGGVVLPAPPTHPYKVANVGRWYKMRVSLPLSLIDSTHNQASSSTDRSFLAASLTPSDVHHV